MNKLKMLSLILSLCFFASCDALLQELENNEEPAVVKQDEVNDHNREKPQNRKGADMPARKNFTDQDLSYQGQAVKLTRHGRCRMECRKLDAYEIQEVINNGKVNPKKTNPNSKPCPTVAYEGKTSDGQMARVVVGTCEGNYKIVTVIDLDTDWKCDCE